MFIGLEAQSFESCPRGGGERERERDTETAQKRGKGIGTEKGGSCCQGPNKREIKVNVRE